MNTADLFLREHGAGHSAGVVRHIMNSDPLVSRLTDAQFRAQPAGLNSLAWLFWHMTRVEDGCVACVVVGTKQLFDTEGWGERLRVPRRDVGTGMTKAEVADLSATIDLSALWAYRDAVGRRTRSLVSDLWPDRWNEPLTAEDLRRAGAEGILDGDEHWLIGTPRESLLFWWGLNHTLLHLGQVMMIKNLLLQG